MRQYTERYVLMISKEQANSLQVLKRYNIKVPQFIKQAIKEKLQREWPSIKEKHNRIKDAPDWLYE